MQKIILFIFTMFLTTASFANDYCATRRGYAAQQDCYNTLQRGNDDRALHNAIQDWNKAYAVVMNSKNISEKNKGYFKQWIKENLDKPDVRCSFNKPCMVKLFRDCTKIVVNQYRDKV